MLSFLLSKIISTIKRQSYVDVVLHHHVKLWTKILERVRPDVVIAISPDAATCIACHRLSIAIYDMQHGVISERIKPYSKNFILQQDKDHLPSGYLCWDIDSVSVLQPWCNTRGLKVIVLGNPWIHRFHKMDKFDELVNQTVRDLPMNQMSHNRHFSPDNQTIAVRKKSQAKDNKKYILITLQYNLDKLYSKFYAPDELIHPVLLEAINASGDEIQWVIRPHPVSLHLSSDVNVLVNLLEQNKNITINWPNDTPLPAVLPGIHGHVTWDSSSVIEASLFGIQSYVLNPEGFWIQKGSNDNAQTELPYAKQEIAGFVTRAQRRPDVASLIKWVREIDIQRDIGPTSELFNEELLYQIATQLPNQMGNV